MCEDHFPQESFTNTRGLKRNAVPIPFESYNINVSNEDDILIPSESDNMNLSSEDILIPSESDNMNIGNKDIILIPSKSHNINLSNENDIQNNERRKSMKMERFTYKKQKNKYNL